MFFSQKICSIHFSCVNLSQQNTKNMNNTYKVSDFLVERNKKIVERFKEDERARSGPFGRGDQG